VRATEPHLLVDNIQAQEQPPHLQPEESKSKEDQLMEAAGVKFDIKQKRKFTFTEDIRRLVWEYFH
jgi:hypothetical protein